LADRTPISLVIDTDYECSRPRAVTSVINRYYDPTTDEFLLIDPEVAQTDQPYEFTNDDPLNTEDPLGLQGSAGIAAETKYREQVAAKCDGHPDANGCRGLDIGKDLLKAAIITTAIVGGAACVVATAGICGAAAFTVGGIELSGGAIAVGVTTGAAEGAADYALDSGKHSVSGYFTNAAEGAGIDALFVGAPEEAVFGGLGNGAHAAELTWSRALIYLPEYLRSAIR